MTYKATTRNLTGRSLEIVVDLVAENGTHPVQELLRCMFDSRVSILERLRDEVGDGSGRKLDQLFLLVPHLVQDSQGQQALDSDVGTGGHAYSVVDCLEDCLRSSRMRQRGKEVDKCVLRGSVSSFRDVANLPHGRLDQCVVTFLVPED